DRVEAAQLRAGLDERLGDDLGDELDMGAARDLGHDAAVPRVPVDLARNHRCAHDPAVVDHRGGGLVAGRLDAEDGRHPLRGSKTVSPGMSASIESRRPAYSDSLTLCAHITSASSFTSA